MERGVQALEPELWWSWEISLRKVGKPDAAGLLLKPSGALWGSQARRPFCSLFLVGKTPASMTFPEFQS